MRQVKQFLSNHKFLKVLLLKLQFLYLFKNGIIFYLTENEIIARSVNDFVFWILRVREHDLYCCFVLSFDKNPNKPLEIILMIRLIPF